MATTEAKTELLTAIYTKPFVRVAITFFADGSNEFCETGLSNLGDVADQDLILQSLAAAEGANVAGWDCKLV